MKGKTTEIMWASKTVTKNVTLDVKIAPKENTRREETTHVVTMKEALVNSKKMQGKTGEKSVVITTTRKIGLTLT